MSLNSDSLSKSKHPQEIKDLLECNICSNILTEPKQLFCGHTFCNICVSKLIRLSNQQTLVNGVLVNENGISCPQCRAFTHIPSGGLKTNFIVKDLISTLTDLENREQRQTDTVACSHCERKTDKSEIFVCNSCIETVIHPTRPICCSLCTIKIHNGHDVKACGEFATEENRKNTLFAIEEYRKSIYSRSKLFEYSFQKHMHEIPKIFNAIVEGVQDKGGLLDRLSFQCSDMEVTPFKEDLEKCFAYATETESKFREDSEKLLAMKEELMVKVYKFNVDAQAIILGDGGVEGGGNSVVGDQGNMQPTCSSQQLTTSAMSTLNRLKFLSRSEPSKQHHLTIMAPRGNPNLFSFVDSERSATGRRTKAPSRRNTIKFTPRPLNLDLNLER